ncbi:hypothetical protein AKI39_01760 [Bordetella sp. H567]|uniref:hypothetical protein n=1 Tax=Bordetella sp. H567 TaxID=1697043 RepID=UPI00081C449F|nr:hypothetical protein [Bordetella sp. H567]AOB29676.1 hypothetical protein AKI39_01760 [Bordetella sp. H567]
MNAMVSPTSIDLRMVHTGAGGRPHHPADGRAETLAEPCDCHAAIVAFESVPGPRRKRAASDDDVIECLDAPDPETGPATIVQRIPV